MTVLITGASSGLGWDLFRIFKSKSHHVHGTPHEPPAPKDSPRDLHFWDAMEGQVGIDHLLEEIGRTTKQFEIVIHCAGINAIRKFEDLDAAFIHDIMQVNFVAPVLLTRSLLVANLLGQGSQIIHVISDAAWRPMRHSLAYNCSKAALDMATKQMARELTKQHQMTVVGIRPGKMSGTAMSRYIDKAVCEMRNWTPGEAQAYYAQNSVTGLETDPRLVAHLIYHLTQSPLIHTMSGACLDLVG